MNMIIQPKVRGFICTTAHPLGCSKAVEEQINYIKAHGQFNGPKNVLIIGASTGYGLASRIAAAFGAGAKTVGISFEREADHKRTATAGWYNTAAFEKFAHQEHLYAKSINGDAFSNEVKQQAIDIIKADLKKVDLVIYSLAAPRRIHPNTGEVFSSTLKPIGRPFTGKTVDPIRGEVKEITLEPATQKEIDDTIAVMGGEDWEMWMHLLDKENLLADGVVTLAYTYIGPHLTHAIYKDGTIGQAKNHLQKTADRLNAQLKNRHGQALLSVNKGLVTQASSAIPVVPLYISLLYKLMKEKNTHEGCIEQINRMFKDYLYTNNALARDEAGRIRLDNFEMQADIQEKIAELWPQVTTENLEYLTDIKGYRDDFYRLFGFNFSGIHYEAAVNPDVKIDSIECSNSSCS